MDKRIELYEDIYKKKFSFGKNWQLFIKSLNKEKVDLAKKSLTDFMKLKSLRGKTFIDVGCGSGLFSLCACLLNAKKVMSMDVDKSSIECTKYLRRTFKISEDMWEIKKGSVLDHEFLKKQESFDIVYSWGVLHHTGRMWNALDNIITLIKQNGLLFIAVYNNFDGFPGSRMWLKIKRFYSTNGIIIRRLMEFVYLLYYIMGLLVYGKNPISYIKNYGKKGARGMNFYRDAVDWLGGYPYEFASTIEIIDFYKKKGFELKHLKETNREGCNQYLFKNTSNLNET